MLEKQFPKYISNTYGECKFSFLALLIMFSVLLFSSQSNAEESHGVFGKWSVYSTMQSGARVCYMLSSPTGKQGNYKRRGEPYMLVTYRGKGVSEVSVNSGYPYKVGSGVEVYVDRNRFSFFTSSDTPGMAWAKDSGADQVAVEKMKRGNRMTAKGYSKLGSYSVDTYSLSGFSKAYDKMTSVCR